MLYMFQALAEPTFCQCRVFHLHSLRVSCVWPPLTSVAQGIGLVRIKAQVCFSVPLCLQNDLANYANIYVLAHRLGQDKREGRITRESGLHCNGRSFRLLFPSPHEVEPSSGGRACPESCTSLCAPRWAAWLCFPSGALSVFPLTSDVGTGDGIPFPNVRTPRSCTAPAPSAAGAVTRPLSRGPFDLCILLTLHSWKEKEQQSSPLAKSHLLVEAATFNLRKVKISSVKRCVGRKRTAGMEIRFCYQRSIRSRRPESGKLSLSFHPVILFILWSSRKAFLSHPTDREVP